MKRPRNSRIVAAAVFEIVPWDARKDMLADGLGALCTAFDYGLVRRNPNRPPEGASP